MRRRNREINIFNMSLLDILCGALGAFCFMMIALLPYYKPPGTEKQTRETQQKIAEKMQQLDDLKKNISDPGVAEDMRKLVDELRQQIQQIQGQLNQALAANGILTTKNAALQKTNSELTAENERLKEMLKKMTSTEALAEMQKRINQLEQQVNQMVDQMQEAAAANTALQNENAELKNENERLDNRVKSLSPISIYLIYDVTQFVDIFLENKLDPTNPTPFDPTTSVAAARVPGDIYVPGGGRTIYVIQKTPPETEYRVFLKLNSVPQVLRYTQVEGNIAGGYHKPIVPPSITLLPERPWQFYGTIRREKNGDVSFKLATNAERDALWDSLPRQKDLPAPGPVVTPRPRPIFGGAPSSTATPPPPTPSQPLGPHPTPPPRPSLDREVKPSNTPGGP